MPKTRSNRYLLMNSLVGAWLVAAVVAVSVHRFVPQPIWLMVHVTLLGAASTAILIWSQYFADTLLRHTSAHGSRSIMLRLAAHTVGTILAVIGMMSDVWLFVLVGGCLIGANALAHGVALWRQLRGALPARFTALVWYYIAAALCLAGGVVLGIMMAAAPSPEEQARLLAGHLALNFFGWISLSVIGTIVLLWPTVLHARLAEKVAPSAIRMLPVFLLGIIVMLVAAATDLPLLVVPGIVIWLAALAPQLVYAFLQLRERGPRSYAGWSLAAGLAWLVFSAVGIAIAIMLHPDWLAIKESVFWFLIPWIGGFLLQVLLGALSHLLPVVLSSHPRGAKAANQMLDKGTVFRIVVINGGIALYLLPMPSIVKVILSLLVTGVFTSFLVLAARAVRVARRPIDRAAPSPEAGSETQNAKRGPGMLTAAVAVLALTVAGGIALDPAAAGIGSLGAQSSNVAATGEITEVTVTVDGMRFVPGTIEVPAGNRLMITFENTGDDVHDLTLASGISTPRLAPGESAELDAGVVGMSMEGWCSIAGHRQMGMVLQVVALGGAAEASSIEGTGDMAGMDHSSTTSTSTASAADDIDLQKEPAPGFEPWPAALAPAPAATTHEVTLKVSEQEREVSPGVSQTMWSFGGSIPGPTLRGKVGDKFIITLVNDGTMGHSIDFHAGALAPDEPMRTIAPGESLTYTFTANRAGIWMYHCSTMPMSLHIANGMFGAVIIDPPGLAPVDQEYLVIQSELYLGAQGEVADAAKIAAEEPDLVVFNGYANQYRFAPLTAKVGERVRVWVLDVGPNRPTSFHIVGGQFDTVFFEGDYQLKDGGSTGVGGSQALGLQAAQGGFVELAFPEAGNYTFVNHAMVDAERGANGIFRITD